MSYLWAAQYLVGDPTTGLGEENMPLAAESGRVRSVRFWTTPDGGGAPGVNIAYPFEFADFLAP